MSSAESKAIERIAEPIQEDEWITMGTLDEEFDLEQVNREIKLRGYPPNKKRDRHKLFDVVKLELCKLGL